MTGLVRYEQALDGSRDGLLHIIFRVGTTEYALGADSVLQMETFTGATPVPGVAPYVAGVVQIRGRVVPVVDLRVRFGEPRGDQTGDSRIVVGQRGDRVVGLLVDSAREVMSIPREEIKPPPPILSQLARGFVCGVIHVGTRIVLLIDFAKIIGEETLDVVD